MEMLCRQCEQTAQGKGCSIAGVCGKDAETAGLQDLLIYALEGIAVYSARAAALGIQNAAADQIIIEGLFTTVTNVNFDPARIIPLIRKASDIKAQVQQAFLTAYKEKNGTDFNEVLPEVSRWEAAASDEALRAQAEDVRLGKDATIDPDIQSLREIVLYGLKGMASYADHAAILGKQDEGVTAFFHKALAAIVNDSLSMNDLVALVLECGQVNLKCMEILDDGHTTLLGNPEPTEVFWGIKPGPAIIVSGHDMVDMKKLLEQSVGSGVNIYTHGEMLPAHSYPELKKHVHLVGHFGTAWQNQQAEFDNVPAVVLMTTNCIQKPRESYADRIVTTGLVAWPGVNHIGGIGADKDFSGIIAQAKELGGFTEEIKERTVTIGFGHATIASVADNVLDLVGQKKIRHFFLIGGCDGAKPGRNYYTDFAQAVPDDCLILTLACGKFRINQYDYGSIEGIPRLLDCGQCNDAYSAIQVAVLLAEKIGCGVNELPLSMILSWYEQKAICILLTLLHLGIKDIRIGPSLPAFITPNVLNVLVDNFNIMPISEAEADLKSILG